MIIKNIFCSRSFSRPYKSSTGSSNKDIRSFMEIKKKKERTKDENQSVRNIYKLLNKVRWVTGHFIYLFVLSLKSQSVVLKIFFKLSEVCLFKVRKWRFLKFVGGWFFENYL